MEALKERHPVGQGHWLQVTHPLPTVSAISKEGQLIGVYGDNSWRGSYLMARKPSFDLAAPDQAQHKQVKDPMVHTPEEVMCEVHGAGLVAWHHF